MKKLLLTSVALTLLTTGPAMAADLRRRSTERQWPFTAGPVAISVETSAGPALDRMRMKRLLLAATVLTAPGSVTYTTSGVIGGAHAGCNVEGTYGVARGWVFGIEGDWSATKLSATQIAPNLFPNGTPIGFGSITFMETTKSLASIRGACGRGGRAERAALRHHGRRVESSRTIPDCTPMHRARPARRQRSTPTISAGSRVEAWSGP